MGVKPLKRRWKVERSFGKAQEWRGERKLFFDHRFGEKL